MKMLVRRVVAFVFLVLAALATTAAVAGEAGPSDVPATAPNPDAQPQPGRMEWFQDLKFGLFMHWGIYCELGCIEVCPWSLSPEGLRVEVPAAARDRPPCEHAWVFQVRGKTARKNDE